MKQQKKYKKPQIKPIYSTCPFGGNPANVDYKDVEKLKKFITQRGRILSRQRTGVSAICQRKLALSIKRARHMALLPFVSYE